VGRILVNRTVGVNTLLTILVSLTLSLHGQGLTGTLTGTTSDQSGAAIVGAKVTAVDDATHAEYATQTGADGHFTIANLNPGTYTVTVAVQGFRKSVFKDVKIIVGQTYDLTAKLELGEVTNTVLVEAGQEVVETTSATVGASITGRSITELPFTSRNTLDLATLMAGAATTGSTRQTSFNGLPKGSINVTYDGINVQDNLLKSSDGFFTIIRPTTDSVEEFSISTAANGAQDASQGAVQIKFETKRGGNAFHGGVWEYFRNDALNSNYYFNNEANPQQPRQVQRLNQYGYKIGGPIIKDKLFFFTAMDNYKSPQSRSFTRAILTQEAVNGLFTYGAATAQTGNAWTTCVASSPRNNGGPVCTVDLAKFAGVPSNGVTFVKDPAISTILANVQAARGNSSISTGTPFNPWLDNAVFNAPGKGSRRFPDVRFDWNITKNHQFTAIYHYAHFSSSPDFLNNANPFLPIDPFTKLLGSQISNRNQYALAWRWNIGSNKSNELRFGLQSSLVAFFPDENPALYPVAKTNLGNINARPVLPGGLFPGVPAPVANFQPFLAFNAQARNTPLGTLLDNFSWTTGKHSFSFGGEVTEIRFHGFLSGGRLVQTANIGLADNDPSSGKFPTSKFPGMTTVANTALKQLYGTLTGRVSGYSGFISVDPSKRQFAAASPNRTAGKQHQFGFYGTDSWRVLPALTFTYGLRWDYQGAPYDTLNESFSPVNGFADVFGVSGLGNLFKPGTTSSIPRFQLNGDRRWYKTDYTNFAPNVGLAWQPNFNAPFLQRIFPGSGKTVFRAGYSISYTREGFNNFNSIAFGNPGIDGNIFADPEDLGGCTPGPYTTPGKYPGGCVTLADLQNGKLQSLKTDPASFPATGTFPLLAFSGQSINMFDPNLRTPRVQSWHVGIQRELGQNMVLEVRYVGNHSTGLWRQDNINEVNIFENGFLTEFNTAKDNLQKNIAGGCGNRFDRQAKCGTSALPIMEQAFKGLLLNSGFGSGGFISFLNNGLAGAFANSLAFNRTNMCNLAGSNAFPGVSCPDSAPVSGPYAANLFVANPHASGGGSAAGAFRFYNGSQSTYNALQVEMRRRLSKGLQFSGNYTFSKSLTNYFGDSSVGFVPFTTLRDRGNDKGASPWDLRHNFKLNGIYELPFGPGHHWSTSNGFANRVIGGWQISTIHRWQSGRVFLLQSGLGGTTNQNDPGVILNGITRNQLQGLLDVRKTPDGQVFYVPASLISGTGAANPSFIAPCNTPGKVCSRVFLTGPRFYRADISLSKKTNITERVNFELRAEMLNAFNNINFFYPGGAATSVPTVSVSSNFGRITNAFQDPNSTDDNGGRIVQLVFRINF